MTRSLFVGTALLMTTLTTGAVAAEKGEEPAEKTLKQGEVPKPVMDAVARKYPKLKAKKFEQETEDGKPVYEVQLASGKETLSIDVSPEGKILTEETTMPPGTLPAPVKAGLQSSKYKGWKVAKAERVIHDEKEDAPEYEVVVQTKKEKFEVVLDRAGKITKEEAKSAKDND